MSDGSRPLPVVFGCAGGTLSSAERAFFKKYNPFGIILFKRNCTDPHQLIWLIKELKQVTGNPDLQILIDQEGGRVARLQPPHWAQYPAARLFGQMYEEDPDWGTEAMQCYGRLVAHDLTQLGFTINCAPVVDLFIDGATPALGDRAISRRPGVIAALARCLSETMLASGVLPVIKHFPGHGRMKTDPHIMLPVVEVSRAELETDDFMAFSLLKDLPIGMNSHAVFTALDPEIPVSLSATIHHDIIRGVMGFDGLMLSDDITMRALHGLPHELARRSLEAGADVVLHCSGDVKEMEAIAEVMTPMGDEGWGRWEHARSMVGQADPNYKPFDDTTRLDILLGGIAYKEKQ